MTYNVSPPEAPLILLVDDDERDRKHWADALRNPPFHYSVLEAVSGKSALQFYQHQPVDCVVLDLDMPESGFFTLVWLVPDRKHPRIPVIIFTRLMHPALFELVKRYGACACLVKQHSSAEDLASTIQQAMASVKSMQASA